MIFIKDYIDRNLKLMRTLIKSKIYTKAFNHLKVPLVIKVSRAVGNPILRQVTESFPNKTKSKLKMKSEAVKNKVLDQVYDQVWEQVYDQVWEQVRGQVWRQVRGQVSEQVRGQVSGQVSRQVYWQVRGLYESKNN